MLTLSSTGLVSIYSNSLAHEGVYSFALSVTSTHTPSAILFSTITYNCVLTVTYVPADIFTASAKALSTSHTYYLLASQETVETYSVHCLNALTSAACGASEVN